MDRQLAMTKTLTQTTFFGQVNSSNHSSHLILVVLAILFGALSATLADLASVFERELGLLPATLLVAVALVTCASMVFWKARSIFSNVHVIQNLKDAVAERESSITSLRSNETELSQRLEAYQSELRRSYKYFRQLMKTFGMATFHCDLENRFEWIHNFSGDEKNILGRTVDDVLPEDAGYLLSILMQDARDDFEIHSGQLAIEVDGETRHYSVQVAPRYDQKGRVNGTICVSSDVTEKARWNDHLAKMTLEVNHRARNLLAIIVSMLGQTAKTALSVDDFQRKITGRVSSLARSIDLISKDSWTATSLMRLVKIQVQHVCPNSEDDIVISGPDICLAPKAIQNIGLAIHELSTNASRIGALSSSGGKIEISWHVFKTTDGNNALRLTWRETGDKVRDADNVQKGLGLKILEDIVAQELGGQSDLTWTKTGLVFEMTIPEDWFESTPLLFACEKLGQPKPAAI